MHKCDILLVQVYVDDIIFGSTRNELCNAFEKLMHEKFQMSSMGELTFFLGLQVKQKNDGIFISQDKYVAEILKRFRYLKGHPKLGLWYLKDSSFDLLAYTDSDSAGASLDRKSTTEGYSDVHPPPPAQIYSSPKKDMSWTGLPEFVDDTVTDYSTHAPTIESSPDDAQNRNPSVTATEASKDKIDKKEIAKKPIIKYAELYRRTSKSSKGVQRLDRELIARTPIHKVDRGRSRSIMPWVPKKV
nr:putative ribonuclease H-like domain-containing protein [Tanacetum cinerariifolium]